MHMIVFDPKPEITSIINDKRLVETDYVFYQTFVDFKLSRNLEFEIMEFAILLGCALFLS